MSDCMPIPDNWKDFVKEYSFKDIREIYTNGSRLIPTFRVEQMMGHFVKPDWISVKDRMPEIGKSVLIYYPQWDGDEIQVAKLEDDGMMFDICGEFNIGAGVVTHWMPLPQKPESED